MQPCVSGRFLPPHWQFTRGWTLQEIIAPQNVEFYDSRWVYLGTKRTRMQDISSIIRVPESVLD